MGDPSSGRSDSNSKTQAEADYTALWEEDQFQSRLVTDLIQSTTNWGSMPAGMIELIKKAAEGKIDFRSALRGFRATILNTAPVVWPLGPDGYAFDKSSLKEMVDPKVNPKPVTMKDLV